MRHIIFIVLSYLLCINIAHAKLFYCPKGGYINVGNTQAQVTTACGQPTSKKTGSVAKKQTVKVEQWFYSLGGSATGQTRVKVTFTIKNNKISQILLDNQKVDSMSLCDGSSLRGDTTGLGDIGNATSDNDQGATPVKVGDSAGTIETFCGEPSFINRTTETSDVGSAKASIWLYDFGPYQPKIELQFVNGKLDSITKK